MEVEIIHWGLHPISHSNLQQVYFRFCSSLVNQTEVSFLRHMCTRLVHETSVTLVPIALPPLQEAMFFPGIVAQRYKNIGRDTNNNDQISIKNLEQDTY